MKKQNLKNNLIEVNPEEFLQKFLVRVDEKIQRKNQIETLEIQKNE